MKYWYALRILLVVFLLTPSCFAQSVDFSGVDAFWEIYDVLKDDRQPTQKQWSELFSTPGLAALEEREHRRQILTRAFRLAYMPSKQDTLDGAVQGDGFLGYILPHLARIPTLRDSLVALQTQLASTDLLGEALLRVQELLPAGLTEKHVPPPIAFVFFAPDGRGYSTIIVADLLNIMESRSRTGFFAHELHHYYRRYVDDLDTEFAENDYYLMYVLINLEEEGIADQLDKADIPTLSEADLRRQVPNARRRGFYEQYRHHYAEANEWLQRVEGVLEEIAASPALSAEKGELLHGELPIGGRPIGAFMAGTIVRELGRNRLVEVVGHSFGFWRLYNEAAAESEGAAYVLSPEAIRVLNKLEEKYGQSEQ